MILVFFVNHETEVLDKMKRKYIFINSMSRTGTGLLYQLLFGHPDIFFPPYRVQIACSSPVGFPLKASFDDSNDFNSTVSKKTTIPVDINKHTDWSNINIKYVSDILSKEAVKPDVNNSLDCAVDFLESKLDVNCLDEEYYCIHDDHLYVLGVDEIKRYKDSKILTNIRSPIDMLSSKKNMLLFHIHREANPLDYEMNEYAIKNELSRAIFSWVVASYEFSRNNCLPILFEHVKGKHRRFIMSYVSNYLGISYHETFETDRNNLNFSSSCNELLFTGSSLNKLTQGKRNTTIKSHKVCLTDKEIDLVSSLIDVEYFNNAINQSPDDFLGSFSKFWQSFEFSLLPHISIWFDMYLSKQNDKLFEKYSSFNYGSKNAIQAFSN